MFKILGADGKEYGPVTTDQLKQWITEGRANRETMAQREGETGWRPLSQFSELWTQTAAPVTAAPAVGMSAAYTAPTGPDPAARANAEKLVGAPAIGLIVTAAIGIANAVLGIVLRMLGIGMMNMGQQQENLPPEVERFVVAFSGGIGVVASVIGIAVGLLIIYGAMKMKRLSSHGLAMTASILAMIPCVSPCCILGLPIGIWAVVVLLKPEVKSQFQ
jgi:hypothetical protein